MNESLILSIRWSFQSIGLALKSSRCFNLSCCSLLMRSSLSFLSLSILFSSSSSLFSFSFLCLCLSLCVFLSFLIFLSFSGCWSSSFFLCFLSFCSPFTLSSLALSSLSCLTNSLSSMTLKNSLSFLVFFLKALISYWSCSFLLLSVLFLLLCSSWISPSDF